ncbi:hypothetical protein D3C74_307620 [compost metagenome]
MPRIPLKQTVVYTPPGGIDPDWNTPIPGDPVAVKCRFQEGVKLVRNAQGDEVVSVGTFYFDRLHAIDLAGKLTYTDELGRESTYTPIAISVKRDISGRPLLTVVDV